MADPDATSSSDDNWFEPEDLTISTTNLLQHQHQPQQTQQSSQDATIEQGNQGTIQPTKEQIETATTTNNEPIATIQKSSNTESSNTNGAKEIERIDKTEHAQSEQHDNIQTVNNNENDIAISNDGEENTTSFPPALQQAYELMQAKKKRESLIVNGNQNDNDNKNESNAMDPSRMIVNKDTGLGYDIDNLPIDIAENPMLSLQKLRESSRKNLTDTKNKQNEDHHSKRDNQKGKYSKFFVKNFFLKKHEDEHKNANDDNDDNDEQKRNANINQIKIKGNTKEKEMKDLRLTQKIENAHKGAIYCMEFSKKGDYLATGGQDSVLRIWTVCGSRADLKRWEKDKGDKEKSEHTKTHTHTHTHTNTNIDNQSQSEQSKSHNKQTTDNLDGEDEDEIEHEYNFDDVISIVAYREFSGHRADIIDISWSNGEFILSASIDQTVMLWHTSRTRCLCLFQHSDIVTSVQFHPNEDYLFLSGSFDSRLRLWNILEHRVVDWVQVPTLVTCTTFSINGKFAIAGLYDGQCFFYSTQGHRLKYVTAIECRNSSGKYRKGRKVTGLQYVPQNINDDQKSKPSSSNNNSNNNQSIIKHHKHKYFKNGVNKNMEHGSPQLLISTNDSRLRLYNLSNFDMKCKYKGHENTQSQIHARFSPDGKLIICGSEDNNIYIWRVEKSVNDETNSIFQSKKSKNRQEYYEYFKSNSKLPQVALFAPHRTIHYIHKYRTIINKNAVSMYKYHEDKIKHIILTADTEGHINIYTNHSHDKDYRYPYSHHSHHHNNHQHSHSHHHHQHRNTNRKSTKKKYK